VPKIAYFWEKSCKKHCSVGGFAPEPPFASGGWRICPQTSTLQLLPVVAALYPFIVLNAFSYYRKN